jgi:protein tyrosine phosphatase (PTP) superfamily phosphohydrolase (DUF442 family)
MTDQRARPGRRRFVRALVLTALLAATSVALAIAYRRATGNLGTVIPGRVYRSAQLAPDQLQRVIERHQIRMVLNLRGPNPDQAWYAREVAVSLEHGVTHISVPLASDQWLSHEQVRTLLDVLDRAEYPLLVHCEFGAERTGLVSALIALLRPESTLRDGLAQFSAAYLFLPVNDGCVMLGHIREYEAWLHKTGQAHDPLTLRRWLLTVYTPGTPSREYWPCDPYPRKVVSRPGPGQTATQEEDWSDNACPPALSARQAAAPVRR